MKPNAAVSLIAGLALAMSATSSVASDNCSTSPWRVVASLEKVEPTGEPIQIEPANGGPRRSAVLFECLLSGDRLYLQGRTVAVELFMAGGIRRVSVAESPFVVPGTASDRLGAAAQALMNWWRLRPRETGAAAVKPRTRGDAELVFKAAAGLGEPTAQRVLPGTKSLVLAWRASQAAAWRLGGNCLKGESVLDLRDSAEATYAVLRLDGPVPPQCQLELLDDGRRVRLLLRVVAEEEAAIGAAAGLPGPWTSWGPNERVAWAAWTLRHGPAEWHLQALTWLHEHKGESWLAGHLFYRVINDSVGSR